MISFPAGSLSTFTSLGSTWLGIRRYLHTKTGTAKPQPIKKQIVKTDKVAVPQTFEEAKVSRITPALFGSANEKSIAEKFAEQTGSKIEKSKKFTYSFGDFSITGRCDGITTIDDKQYIVEIKTRVTAELGMTIKERIQCLAYCECMAIPGLIFIEQDQTGDLVIFYHDNFADLYSATWTRVLHDLQSMCDTIIKIKDDPGYYIEESGEFNRLRIAETIIWV